MSCHFPGCKHETMVSDSINICYAHAIQIRAALTEWERPPSPSTLATQQQLADRHAARKAKEIAANTIRINAGMSPSPDTFAPSEFVYYIRVGEHIKIGYTANLANRVADYPPNAELLATEIGGKDVERQRHHQFHARLAWGREWFVDCQELRDHIASLPPLVNTGRKRMRRGPSNRIAANSG